MSVKTIPASEYADKLLQGRDSISSGEFPMADDFDYVMSIMLLMEYDSKTSPYHIDFGEGSVSIGRYSIPNLTISRR